MELLLAIMIIIGNVWQHQSVEQNPSVEQQATGTAEECPYYPCLKHGKPFYSNSKENK